MSFETNSALIVQDLVLEWAGHGVTDWLCARQCTLCVFSYCTTITTTYSGIDFGRAMHKLSHSYRRSGRYSRKKNCYGAILHKKIYVFVNVTRGGLLIVGKGSSRQGQNASTGRRGGRRGDFRRGGRDQRQVLFFI